MTTPSLEWWQRGPIDGVPDMLQPVAHMLLQLRDEVPAVVNALPLEVWNARPANVASVGYHVRHIAGVLDRLFTYARGASLNDEQFAALRREGDAVVADEPEVLLAQLSARVDTCLAELRGIDASTLAEVRLIGRAKLPSTVLGCIVHGAEHSMRHLGQLIVTARVAAQAMPAPS
jgi:uncharacterized damage-inducible protein DinB